MVKRLEKSVKELEKFVHEQKDNLTNSPKGYFQSLRQTKYDWNNCIYENGGKIKTDYKQ